MITTLKGLHAEITKGRIVSSHTSWTRGYVSRKPNADGSYGGAPQPYNGRFGRGYTVCTPSWQSSQYCQITYYLCK